MTAAYTCSDEAGGSQLDAATPCPADERFDAEGAHRAVTFSVRDNAGNTSAPATRRQVRIDTTAPAVAVELRDGSGAVVAPNAAGWFGGPVTVDFTCSDGSAAAWRRVSPPPGHPVRPTTPWPPTASTPPRPTRWATWPGTSPPAASPSSASTPPPRSTPCCPAACPSPAASPSSSAGRRWSLLDHRRPVGRRRPGHHHRHGGQRGGRGRVHGDLLRRRRPGRQRGGDFRSPTPSATGSPGSSSPSPTRRRRPARSRGAPPSR